MDNTEIYVGGSDYLTCECGEIMECVGGHSLLTPWSGIFRCPNGHERDITMPVPESLKERYPNGIKKESELSLEDAIEAANIKAKRILD